jgi:hypothetical protein
MPWDKLLVDLGTVKPKEKKSAIFNFIGDIKVLSVETSCGCTGANWNERQQRLVVDYTGVPIPIHIIAEGRNYILVTQSCTLKTLVNGEPKAYKLMIKIKVQDVRIF